MVVVAGEVGNRSMRSFAERDIGRLPFGTAAATGDTFVLMVGILGAIVARRTGNDDDDDDDDEE